MAARRLPVEVFGPVDLRAFRRLAAIRRKLGWRLGSWEHVSAEVLYPTANLNPCSRLPYKCRVIVPYGYRLWQDLFSCWCLGWPRGDQIRKRGWQKILESRPRATWSLAESNIGVKSKAVESRAPARTLSRDPSSPAPRVSSGCTVQSPSTKRSAYG